MKIKEFHRPKTVDAAVALLGGINNAKIIAGGTDIVIAINERQTSADALIDVSGIDEIRRIREEGGALRIGSAVTFSEIRQSEMVRKICPSLCEAASQMGAEQVRNLATLGGNVANAATAADGIPPLLSVNALATVCGPKGIRRVPVAEIVTGVNRNSLACDEIITDFQIEVKPRAAKVFEKIGRRKALAISRINLAVCAEMDGKTVKKAAVAVGAVGKTAYCVKEVEDFLKDKELSAAVIDQAANLMDDVVARNLAGRSTTPYKRKIAWAVLKRALERVAGGEGL